MLLTNEDLMKMTGIELVKIESIKVLGDKRDKFIEQEQIKHVQALLTNLIGNMDTNQKLKKIEALSKRETGIDSIVLEDLKNLSYRTRYFNKIAPNLDEILKNFEEVINSKGERTLDEKKKISLEQFGFLYDMAYLVNILNEYNKLELIKGSEKLEDLYKKALGAQTIVGYLDNNFNRSFKMDSGVIIFDRTTSKSKIYGKQLSFFERIVSFFVTKFGHVSQGLTDETNNERINMISHINPTYKKENFNLRNYLYSDVYKIKFDNLIDSKTKSLLEKHFGNDWLMKLEQKYSLIEREIHDSNKPEKYIHVIADGSKRRQTSLAIAPFFGGHKNFFMKDHNNADIRDDIFGRGRWESAGKRQKSRLLCSEFIGKTLIAAIEELNDVIKNELYKKNCEKQDIPAVLIINPINEKEKLYLLTPQRLLQAMLERGAVERVKNPEEINKLVCKHIKIKDKIRGFFKADDKEKNKDIVVSSTSLINSFNR